MRNQTNKQFTIQIALKLQINYSINQHNSSAQLRKNKIFQSSQFPASFEQACISKINIRVWFPQSPSSGLYNMTETGFYCFVWFFLIPTGTVTSPFPVDVIFIFRAFIWHIILEWYPKSDKEGNTFIWELFLTQNMF